MAYKGKYRPKNKSKYRGDVRGIVYRSLLERRFMVFCDNNKSVIWWNSEEVIVPYISPVDNRWHRYFVDFLVKLKTKNGDEEIVLIEVKPYRYCKPPKKMNLSGVDKRTKQARRYLREATTWGINSSKWDAATKYSDKKGWTFKIITDKELK
jgi:hypothetical protein